MKPNIPVWLFTKSTMLQKSFRLGMYRVKLAMSFGPAVKSITDASNMRSAQVRHSINNEFVHSFNNPSNIMRDNRVIPFFLKGSILSYMLHLLVKRLELAMTTLHTFNHQKVFNNSLFEYLPLVHR